VLADQLGVDAEVVEAACLAHDLGHPPFGHIGEKELDALVTDAHDNDGFEGNAQSFRIVTKLAVRFQQVPGLNLTRATLNACLKYPWLRDRHDAKKKSKWSAYLCEQDELVWAREGIADGVQSPEAHLMDWADDIAYSVHDLEDFHRCSAIPWTQIVEDGETRAKLVRRAKDSWFGAPDGANSKLESAYDALFEFLAPFVDFLAWPYEGTREQRQQLRSLTSILIDRYLRAAKLVEGGSGVEISEEEVLEVKILKQITREYILSNPSLVAQQRGQQRIIRFLFNEIMDSIEKAKPQAPSFLPRRLADLWTLSGGSHARFACDCVSSLTEREANALFARLAGTSVGSVLDPIVR
jgi:dGTPase